MNIFALSPDPKQAAQMHCDKHVVKMILESAQLLYSAHWMVNPDDLPSDAYKKTHVNHPCAIWVRESRENYQWLCHLAYWLCEEYTYRYGRIHATHDRIIWLGDNVPELPSIPLTPFRMAMPEEFKCDDPVLAYKKYYLGAKQRMFKYTLRREPEFILMKRFT
jgi:hypothetical protein